MDKSHTKKINLISIDIDEFNDHPGPYCMSFGFDNSILINSIKKIGLLNYPFVIREDDRAGRFQIVSGYRRVMALKALGWKRVWCNDLSQKGMSKIECLVFNLMDNLSIREFNNIEKGMILNRLSEFLSDREIRENYINLFKVSGQRNIDLLKKIEGLSETDKLHIVNESISLKVLEMLFILDKKSVTCMLDLINKLKLNFNQQIQFTENIIDISIKEEKRIEKIISDDIFSDLFNDKNLNIRQKANLVIELLRMRRFPMYTGYEKAFKNKINKIGLPKNTKITHSQFFESPDFVLEITFKNGSELKETMDRLAVNNELSTVCEFWEQNT